MFKNTLLILILISLFHVPLFANDIEQKTIANKSSSIKDTTYGEEEERAKAYFLRNTTVLTSKGEFSLGVRLKYQHAKTDYTLAGTTLYAKSTYTLDSLKLLVDLSYGIFRGFEVFITPSLTYNIGTDSIIIDTIITQKVGLSDIVAGVRYLIIDESSYIPSISINATVVIPIGYNSDGSDGGVALSGGHWGNSAGIGIVKSFDPAIIFGGVAVGYQYAIKKYDIKFTPGFNANLYVGLGLAITDSLSFSQVFYIGYNQDIYLNNERQHGSNTMPFTIRSGISYQTWGRKTWTFDIDYGIYEDPTIGITIGFYI